MYMAQYSVFKGAQMGLVQALAGAGYGFEIVELTAGLQVALDQTDALSQWLSGESVFGDIALNPDHAEVKSLRPWTPTFELAPPPDG